MLILCVFIFPIHWVNVLFMYSVIQCLCQLQQNYMCAPRFECGIEQNGDNILAYVLSCK